MKKSTLTLVELGILTALSIVMSVTPLGFLHVGVIEISFMMIPVVIGAMVLGTYGGLIMGTVFGILSFIQCFGASPFGAMLLSINPFLAFLVCVPTRSLAGLCTGLLFTALKKVDKTKTVSFFITGLAGAFFNTLFFISVLLLCYYRTDYIQTMMQDMGAISILQFVILFVGLNGLIEMGVTAIIGGGLGKGIRMAFHKTSDGQYV